MSESPTIVTLTMNPAVDVSTSIEDVRADVKLRCERPTRRAGGGGLNVARVIARLGADVTAIHTCGGTTGRLLEALLREEGLTGQSVEVADETRENIVVVEVAGKRHFHFVMPGPELSRDEWRVCLDAAGAAGNTFVVASGSLPPGVPADFYARLAERVRSGGGRLALDASGEPLRLALEVGVWMIKPNVVELGELTGIADTHEASLVDAADALVHRGSAELVVLSLGPAGAYATGLDLKGEHLRSPVVPVGSRVGAGDSMVGALVTAASRGMTTRQIVRLGLAGGAAAVIQEGSEVAQAADVWRLYSRLEHVGPVPA
jgi:6-phosphofructokinase 2